MDDGRFRDADDLLAAASDETSRQAREELREIIRRIRREHTLGSSELLAKIRPSIPDITPADLDRWTRSGEAQYRLIDGQLRYFDREPANIFRFCPDAIRRQLPAPTTQPAFITEHHLADVIAASSRTGKSLILPIRHHGHYTLTVPPNLAKPGQLVRCWLPFPQEYSRQWDVKLLSASPGQPVVAPPAGSPHRSLYLEHRVADASSPIAFKMEFEFTSWAYYPALDDALAKPLPSSYSAGHLAERPPHILFTPALRQAVAEAVGGQRNPLARARAIFDWVATHIRYCAEEEYCTIPSFSEKALRTRKGDCGIQTMLFIAMCRCAGIPARWQSGWESRPGLVNMHDWAEFYVEPWGWLPADPSYGLRDSPDPLVRHFYFGHIDSYRMIVNFDYGCPLHPPKPSFRSEPADFQRGEVELAGRNLYFDEWDFDMAFEYQML